MPTHITSWNCGFQEAQGKNTQRAWIRAGQRMGESALRMATRRCLAPAVAGTLALAMACGVGAAEIGGEPEATTLPESIPETALGYGRHVCACYDAERATYTGSVAVLEAAEGAAYRLVVLTTHEDTPETAGEQALTDDLALALLGNAQAALREGRATREEYRGHAVREGNRLRFTSAEGYRSRRMMTVFTTAGLAIIESSAGDRSTRSDGPYRCVPPQTSGSRRPLLPTHCAEVRSGSVDLESFPAPEAEVTLIQAALDKAGMTPGPIDGILGPRTLGALIRWNEHSVLYRGRIVAYEILCPLIERHSAEQTQ